MPSRSSPATPVAIWRVSSNASRIPSNAGPIRRRNSSPRGGQHDAPACAVEQPAADPRLQAADGLADARRGDPEPGARPPEMKLVGDGEKNPDLAELDRRPHREAKLHKG
jgi:hypothetical protein